MESFDSVDAMLEDIGKKVRSMPQIKINDELIGGYNQLIEHFVNEGKVDYQGNIREVSKDKGKFDNVILFRRTRLKNNYAVDLKIKENARLSRHFKFVETACDKINSRYD